MNGIFGIETFGSFRAVIFVCFVSRGFTPGYNLVPLWGEKCKKKYILSHYLKVLLQQFTPMQTKEPPAEADDPLFIQE